jgi:hypothetical protein
MLRQMRCLFCKELSNGSRSREHIIPESLGNHTLILPVGVVCDRCNNYFAREVEKPFLELPLIRRLRYEQVVPTKRGRSPSLRTLAASGGGATLTAANTRAPGSLIFDEAGDLVRLLGRRRAIVLSEDETLTSSASQISRFVAKVALEYLAAQLYVHEGGVEYLTDEPNLDDLRDHVRRGKQRTWPTSVRRIYNADARWAEEGRSVQRIWEVCFFGDTEEFQYFAVALFGLEFVIHLGSPDFSGYRRWLILNGGKSPLFTGPRAGDLMNRLPDLPRARPRARRVLLGYRT